MRYRPFPLLILAAFGTSHSAVQAAAPDSFAGRPGSLDLAARLEHPTSALQPAMPDTGPTGTAFDRTAATILGSMIMLIAALSFALVELSVEGDDESVPVAAWAPERAGTP